ncbi:MAG: glycine cleavage system protein GcvH [Parachlamydiales bacterium]|nr:glycine cleavage system protein GcvH [Parachlamydiales bacterium]
MKFTESHEWILVDKDNVGTIGITNHAQNELGDIVYVELPEIGKRVKAGQEAVVLESTKAAADIYSPVSGKIIAVNENLSTEPNQVNRSPQEDGWLYKIELSHPQELETLLDEISYKGMLTLH